jgi:hypothetical protein
MTVVPLGLDLDADKLTAGGLAVLVEPVGVDQSDCVVGRFGDDRIK